MMTGCFVGNRDAGASGARRARAWGRRESRLSLGPGAARPDPSGAALSQEAPRGASVSPPRAVSASPLQPCGPGRAALLLAPPSVGSSLASESAGPRPTPPALARPVPAPTPPRPREGWASAPSRAEPGTRLLAAPRPRAGRSKCTRARSGAGGRLRGSRLAAGGRTRAGNFLPALQVRAAARGAAAAAAGRRARAGARRSPPPLPPPASSSSPAPRARPSRGTPGGAAPPRPARLAPTPPPPSGRSGRTESAGAPGAAGADMDPNPRAALERQQLRLRERQKFFEDILQPDTEFVFPLSHLHLESQRPPIGSISSMEVNVDTLEQVELIDLGDQDGADVFLPCEDPPPTPQTAGMDDRLEDLSLPMATSDRTTSRTSSSSSDDSTNLHSPNPSDGGADTPLAQSDEEDGGDGGAEPGACS